MALGALAHGLEADSIPIGFFHGLLKFAASAMTVMCYPRAGQFVSLLMSCSFA